MTTIYSRFFTVEKKGSLFFIMNSLQKVAGAHANELGFGKSAMKERKVFWVIARQHLQMKKWPVENSEIEIKTWSRPLRVMNAYRDFQIFNHEKLIGECSSNWLILNSETRSVVRPEIDADILKPMQNSPVRIEARKVRNKDNSKYISTIEVEEKHLDFNSHVNNAVYSNWVDDLLKNLLGSEIQFKNFEINFINEAVLGNEIKLNYINIGDDHFVSGFSDKIIFTSRVTLL